MASWWKKRWGFGSPSWPWRVGLLVPAWVVRARNLGLVTGADGMMALSSDLVRIPDSRSSPGTASRRKVPKQPIPKLAPDLAVEVLKLGNTQKEMARKLCEYFKAGVTLVWIIDPEARTATVYTSPKKAKILTEAQQLNGGDVLPGFTLPLCELFAELDQQKTP